MQKISSNLLLGIVGVSVFDPHLFNASPVVLLSAIFVLITAISETIRKKIQSNVCFDSTIEQSSGPCIARAFSAYSLFQ